MFRSKKKYFFVGQRHFKKADIFLHHCINVMKNRTQYEYIYLEGECEFEVSILKIVSDEMSAGPHFIPFPSLAFPPPSSPPPSPHQQTNKINHLCWNFDVRKKKKKKQADKKSATNKKRQKNTEKKTTLEELRINHPRPRSLPFNITGKPFS